MHSPTTIHMQNTLLYNFELNPKAHTLKKTTREELKRQYNELKIMNGVMWQSSGKENEYKESDSDN